MVPASAPLLFHSSKPVVPSFAVPAEDIRAELSTAPALDGEVPGVLHPGIPFGVHTAAGDAVEGLDQISVAM